MNQNQHHKVDHVTSLPRSILFSPGQRTNLIEKAARGEADAVCIDLEDAVPQKDKPQARESLAPCVNIIKSHQKLAYVRINSELENISYDLAHLPKNTDVVLLPKVTGFEQLNMLSQSLERLQIKAGIIPLIENSDGLANIISENQRLPASVIGFTLGPEDLSLDLHCDSESELIFSCLIDLAKVAAKHKVALFGYAGSIANFKDLNLYKENALKGVSIGALGGLCIHPKQVKILNQIFTPSSKKIEWAKKVITAFDENTGIANVDGRMVDKPVYLNAIRILKWVYPANQNQNQK